MITYMHLMVNPKFHKHKLEIDSCKFVKDKIDKGVGFTSGLYIKLVC